MLMEGASSAAGRGFLLQLDGWSLAYCSGISKEPGQ